MHWHHKATIKFQNSAAPIRLTSATSQIGEWTQWLGQIFIRLSQRIQLPPNPLLLCCQSVSGMKGGKACLVAWWMVGDRTRFWTELSPWALGENRAARQQATLYFPARRIQILISISCSPRIPGPWASHLFIPWIFFVFFWLTVKFGELQILHHGRNKFIAGYFSCEIPTH